MKHPTTPRHRRGPVAAKALVVTAVAVTAAALIGPIAGPATSASALSGETRMHDTTAIHVDGCTWIYSTGFENDPANPTGAVTMHRTCDPNQVIGWEDMGPIWDTVPAWITARYDGVTPPNYWAPDINYFNGKYYLYYAASLWQNNQVASTGLATADSPGGPWTDQGEVTNVNYPIDGNVAWAADGSPYISWGSWAGTYLHKLDPVTGNLAADDTLTKISTGIENGAILPRDGYYYLFGSRGSCCSGVNSTYYTVVGRSTSITGPYLDKNGRDMADGGGSTILSGFGGQVAAGGGDWYDDGGQLYFAYHYYDANANGRETGNIRPFDIVDGWPVMGDPVGSIVNRTAPSVSGHAHIGQTLTADPGTWSVDGLDYAYSWSRDGAPIAGATASTYSPVGADLAHSVAVSVTASRNGYDSGTATTASLSVTAQLPLDEGLASAEAADLSGSTQGSGELFRREVAAIRLASQAPDADTAGLESRLDDAYGLLVSRDTLLAKQTIERPWITASTPIFGGAGTAADNGWALVDGDLATFVNGDAANGSVSITPPAGTSIAVDRLRVYPRSENLEGRLVGHRFEGSNDGGATWETFATLQSGVAGQWTTVDLPTTKTYQRIRMVDDHGGWINAAEAEFWARSVDTTLVTLLLQDAAAVNAAQFTPASVAPFVAARDAALAMVDPTQAEADAASAALRAAIAGLVRGEGAPGAGGSPGAPGAGAGGGSTGAGGPGVVGSGGSGGSSGSGTVSGGSSSGEASLASTGASPMPLAVFAAVSLLAGAVFFARRRVAGPRTDNGRSAGRSR